MVIFGRSARSQRPQAASRRGRRTARRGRSCMGQELATLDRRVNAGATCAIGVERLESGDETPGRMLNLMKLAVGVRDIAHLAELQAARAAILPPLRHRTRSFPRRAAEILEGGSMYWVIAGAMVVRQPILDIIEDRRDDGTH